MKVKPELVSFKTINTGLAEILLESVVKHAVNMGLSGFAVVYSSTGMQECSRAVGPNAKPLNVQVALAKIKTVLIRRQSTSVWRRKIAEEMIRPEDYAGAVMTLFAGGCDFRR